MAFDFRFPDVGEGITEGHIVKWLVKEGDIVKQDQVLAEIETDKAVVEIPSPKAGTILKINFKDGDTVKVGEVLVSIGVEGEKVGKFAVKEDSGIEQSENRTSHSTAETVQKESFGVVGTIEDVKEVLPTPRQAKKETTSAKILATPRIRELAKKAGIDINSIKGSGLNGMITEQDILNVSKIPAKKEEKKVSGSQTHKASFNSYGKILKIPMTPIRKAIAKKMHESKSKAAHTTAMIDVDISELALVREKEKKAAENKGIHLTFLAFIVKACVIALEKNPYLNAELDEENELIVTKSYYNIGIAVDTPAGLLVPVIKKASTKSILDVAHDIETLAESARSRKIGLDDLNGGSFTITNWGSVGASYGVPVINFPEVAILGVGRAEDKPVVVGKVIKIRKILPLSLSFDHRVVDGAMATRFLMDLKSQLENPSLFMINLD